MLSFLGFFQDDGPSGFGARSTAREVVDGLDLSGQHILVTGCNSGLGAETMKAVAERGATVFGLARTHRKAKHACQEVDGRTVPVACELSEPASIQSAVEHVTAYLEKHDTTLDAVICNAGIMALPELQQAHGYELQFFVNHVGHFILTTGLLDELADDGRVVMLSSRAHRRAPAEGIQFDNLSGEHGYDDWTAYGQSKLANMLFARELARRFDRDDSQRVALAVHPGVVMTNIARNLNVVLRKAFDVLGPLFLKSSAQGAATQVYAAAHPDARQFNGDYLADCRPRESTEHGRDRDMAERLWERTEAIVDEVTE